MTAVVIEEKNSGSGSPSWISRRSQSMVVPSSRGGVPVLSRPSAKPAASRLWASETEGGSPKRPAGVRWSPRWIIPRRKVPVVRTIAAAGDRAAVSELDSRDGAGVGSDPGGFAFDDGQVRGLADERLHGAPIELSVGLGARALDGWAFAAIEDAELNARRIGGARHDAIERIDLAHQMALAQAADRRIAGHLADCRETVGDQRGSGAAARRRGRGFAPCVPAADDNDVKSHVGVCLFHVKHLDTEFRDLALRSWPA